MSDSLGKMKGRWGFVASVLVLGISVGVIRLAGPSGAQSVGPPLCEFRRQETTVTMPQVGATLGSVDTRTEPKIDAQRAAQIAHSAGWDNLGGEKATFGCATLVSYTSAQMKLADGFPEESAPTTPVYADQLVWIVSNEGVCVPVFGPLINRQEMPDCAGKVINVVVDASDGHVIEAFDNPHDDTPSSLSPSDQ